MWTSLSRSLSPELRVEIQGFRPMTQRKTVNLNPTATPFPSLSGEIRNLIYPYALLSPHRLRSKGELKRHEIRNLQTRKDSHPTALLATCRRIFHEALPFFYQENRFHNSIPPHYTASAGRLDSYLPRPLALHFEFLEDLSIDYRAIASV